MEKTRTKPDVLKRTLLLEQVERLSYMLYSLDSNIKNLDPSKNCTNHTYLSMIKERGNLTIKLQAAKLRLDGYEVKEEDTYTYVTSRRTLPIYKPFWKIFRA